MADVPLPPTIAPALAPKKKLFGQKNDISPVTSAPPMTQEFNKLNTRLRISEERYSEVRKQISLIESNMLANHKKAIGDVRSLAGDILDMKRTIADLENKMMLLIKEIQLTSKKEEVDVIKKYLEFWEPVHFVTRRQVEGMIEDALAAKKELK
jgi:hypothetical protein